MFHFTLFICIMLFGVGNTASILEEPRCSKYDFEEKVLEKLIRLEIKVENVVAELRKSLDTVSERQTELEERIKDTKEDVVAQTTGQAETLTAAIDANKQGLESLNKSLSEVGNGKRAAIYSTAFIARNPDKDLPQNAGVVFKTIVLNEGKGYDASSGKFTAPVSGTYTFSVQICSKLNNYSRYQLVTSTLTLGAAQQYDKDKEGVCSSMTTVAKLQAGEAVWVKCVSKGSEVIEHSEDHWNMFVGALINGTA